MGQKTWNIWQIDPGRRNASQMFEMDACVSTWNADDGVESSLVGKCGTNRARSQRLLLTAGSATHLEFVPLEVDS